MNNASSSIFQKIASHIDYYYWNPQPGHSPRWVNILIFIISIFLWFGVWIPIKVKTIEERPLSVENGDDVYVARRTGFSFKSFKEKSMTYYSTWMQININNKLYWCICEIKPCPRLRSASLNEKKDYSRRNRINNILIINNNYCIVKSMLNYRNEEVILSSDRITYLIKYFGPMEIYLWFKIFLLFFWRFICNLKCITKLLDFIFYGD